MLATTGATNRTRLLFAASTGGHLGQAIELQSQVPFPSIVVTTDSSRAFLHSSSEVAFLPSPGGFLGWTKNAIAALVLALRLRPSLVVALGSGGVAFFCLWARLLGSRIVLVESFARVRTVSRFLRYFSSISHRILVQWPGAQAAHPAAVLVHPIYNPQRPKLGALRKIFVTVGSYKGGMDRLLRIVDEASPIPGNPSMMFQIGNSTYRPKFGAWVRWAAPDKFARMLEEADLVITHDGANTIAQALQARKPVIVVPRTRDELDYASEGELAAELNRRGWVLIANTSDDLRRSIISIAALNPTGVFSGESSADRIVEEYQIVLGRRSPPTAEGKNVS